MKLSKKNIIFLITGIALLIGIGMAIQSVSSSLKKIESSAFSSTKQIIPCNGNPASKIEIASPVQKPTEFTVEKGDYFFVVMKKIEDNAVLSYRFATIRIGALDQQPQWSGINGTQATDLNDKTIVKLDVGEGVYTKVNLKSGQYWLWANNGSVMEILSCTPNGVSVVPQK
jgi:hypothetical protein